MKLPQIIIAAVMIMFAAYCAVPKPQAGQQQNIAFQVPAKGKSSELDARWQRSKYEIVPSSGNGDLTEARIASAKARANGAYENQGSVILPRQSDGHYYADADVDGGSVRFMVDTGASSIALTGSDAEALGLSWTEDELRPVGRGASGMVIGKPVRLGSVSVGGFTARNVDAVILPRGLDVSLLGQSFLSKVRSVNIQNGNMILS